MNGPSMRTFYRPSAVALSKWWKRKTTVSQPHGTPCILFQIEQGYLIRKCLNVYLFHPCPPQSTFPVDKKHSPRKILEHKKYHMNCAIAHLSSMFRFCYYFFVALTGPFLTLGICGAWGLLCLIRLTRRSTWIPLLTTTGPRVGAFEQDNGTSINNTQTIISIPALGIIS